MIRSPLRRRTVRTSVAAFAAAVSLLDARGALVAQDSAPASRAASRPAENRLAAERSLYLRLHATNPVDWHPFGAEAFERARREDKPVFLSIGYSSCHWCHVMARESFEDETIAAFLNERFVCVKVDREERPDVDRVYIDACLRLNGAAGWPLTAFLAPDRRPFYVATYLPPDDRFGEPGLLSVARSVARLWSDRRADLVDAGAIYAEAFSLRHLPTPALKALVAELERKTFDAVLAAASRPATAEAESESAAEPEESDVLRARLERARAALAERDARRTGDAVAFATAVERLRAMEDFEVGGFGLQPKFPAIPSLLLLLRAAARAEGDAAEDARAVVFRQLDAMRRGGIRDHVGGGFHRYAVDRKWRTPHFEKMLYDQALIARAYAEAATAKGDAEYEALARETLAFCLRDLRLKDGAFAASFDAESGGEEGGFYMWSRDEIAAVLGESTAARALLLWSGFEADGSDPKERLPLCERVAYEDVGGVLGVDANAAERLARSTLPALAAERRKRPPPRRDDAAPTAMNALLASSFARAGVAFAEPAYVREASVLIGTLRRSARGDDGLYRRFCDSRPSAVAGDLVEQAFVLEALLDVAEATLDRKLVDEAAALAARVEAVFGAADGGLFDSIAGDLPWRTRQTEDDAWPSGSSAAALAFVRIAKITEAEADVARARRTCDALAVAAADSPAEHGTALTALDLLRGETARVAIEGADDAARTLLHTVRRSFRPFAIVAPTAATTGSARAIVCVGTRCLEPASTPEELIERLKDAGF